MKRFIITLVFCLLSTQVYAKTHHTYHHKAVHHTYHHKAVHHKVAHKTYHRPVHHAYNMTDNPASFAFATIGTVTSSPRWLMTAMHDVGTNPTGRKSKWCGAYMDRIMPGGAGNLALNWRYYGRPSSARPGAIAVMYRKGGGHVGIVGPQGCSHGKCQIVSGNHNHKVGVGYYAEARIVAFRWPT